MDLELLAIFGSSFVLGLSGALFPGPLVTLTVRESVLRGASAGPILSLGHAAIELGLVLLLLAGLDRALDEGPVTATIGLVGGVVLLLFAYQTLRAARTQTLDLRRPEAAGDGRRPRRVGTLAVAGALVSASNPYWVNWWATVGAAAMTASLESGAAGIVSFFTGHILSDFAWLTFVSVALTGGKRLVSSVAYRAVLAVCGVFLGLLGAYFIASASTLV